MIEEIDWWAKQPSQLACFSEDLNRSQGHHSIDRLEERGVERGVERGSAR